MRHRPSSSSSTSAALVGAFLLFVIALVLIGSRNARGHGDADWIRQSPDFSWCCSKRDCEMIPAGGVRVVPGGYLILETGETIPEEKAKPSPDGEFWRCRTDASNPASPTRCFFRAPPGS